MNGKLKALGLGMLAAWAITALAAMNASASVSGHFTHDALGGHAVIKGAEGGEHRVKFEVDGKTFECNVASSEGTVSAGTVTTIAVTPAYANCQTPGESANSILIDTNGCHFVYHSRSSGHATFSLECPSGAELVVTHPNCKVDAPAQTASGGVIYGTAVSNPGNKHELTLATTLTLTAQYEGGICIFLGTGQHQLSMTGSSTLAAFSTSGEQVNLTAT